MMTLKRCICGASKDFPICDGSHSSRGWSCQGSIEQTERLILYTPSLHSLSQWCAHTLSIPTIDSYKKTQELQAQTLILLYDGQHVDALEHWLQRIPHQREEWIHIGEQFHPLPLRERHSAIHVIHRRWLLHLPLPKNLKLEDLEEGHPYPIQPRRIFASHAIQDEKTCFL